MAIVSFIPVLVQGVRDYFTAYGVTASVVFGRKALTRQDNQGPGGANRVCFAPDEKTAGQFIGSRQNVGQNPRSIVTWRQRLIVQVWAVNATNYADELLQYTAFEDLLEQTVAAIRSVAHADALIEEIADLEWEKEPLERAFGMAGRFVLQPRGPLFGPTNATIVPTLAPIDKQLKGGP